LNAYLEALVAKNKGTEEILVNEKTVDDFIKEMTREHSDLTFLSWGDEIDKSIIIMPEGKNKKKQ